LVLEKRYNVYFFKQNKKAKAKRIYLFSPTKDIQGTVILKNPSTTLGKCFRSKKVKQVHVTIY